MQLQRLFLTFFGLGNSPKYPKLTTMIIAMISGLVILYYMGLETLSMLTVAGAIIALFEINKYYNNTQKESRYTIVIDRVVGIWLMLLIIQPTLTALNYPFVVAIALFVGLLSYWFFDTKKPSTIGWLYHNLKGGLGIITSMLLTAFAAGFLTIVVLRGIHFLFTL